jgi:K+-transporting ATPase c subunit
MKHLRTNLLLLGLTLAICGVAYPLVLWVVGQVVFPNKANGSLLTVKGPDGTERVVGSGQVAQRFTTDEYFWPRPSAADYNAAAAGGSNFGANSPKLRDRVAQQLGPIVQYKKGSASAGIGPEPRTPQQDIEAWFATRPDRASELAAGYPTAAARTDAPVVATYFDMWLQDPANRSKVADLEPVPADMVTASGAGLDPHITLRNALSVYQLDRIAAKRTPPGGNGARVRSDIAELAKRQSFTPLSGLVGEPLVNVLELNVELDRQFPVPSTPAKAP